MSRIAPINYNEASPEIQAEHDRVLKAHGSISNMKQVLLHSPVASRAVLEWYKLFDAVKPVIGQRRAILFCDAISRENACKLCASFMRRSIIQGGENPEALDLDEKDQAIVEYGRQLAANANRVTDALYERLQAFLTPPQIVDLTVFGALMIVNNVFNSALQIDIDGALNGFEVTPEVAFAQSTHFDKTLDT